MAPKSTAEGCATHPHQTRALSALQRKPAGPRRKFPSAVFFRPPKTMLYCKSLRGVAPVLIAFFVLCDESIAFHVLTPLTSHAHRGRSISSLSSERYGVSCLRKARPPTSIVTKMALDQAVVEKYIAQASEPSSSKAPNKLAKALKKMSGSIAVAIGYHFDPARAPRPIKNLMTNTLEGSDAKADLRLYSMLMRKEKAAALFMDCSTEQGRPGPTVI
jgi:hypothetical protein